MINVKNMGARGNGVSDDTSALQKAFNQASANRDTVYFPSGTYLVNSTKNLTVKSNTMVTGAGASSIIKAFSSPFGSALLELSGSNIQLSGIVVDGNKAVNRVVVVGSGSSDIKIVNCVVANASQSNVSSSPYYNAVIAGILVYGNTNRVTIDKTEIRNVIALHPLSGSLIARGVYVTRKWNSNESPSNYFTLSNCYIHDIGPADDGDGIYFEDETLDSGQGQNVNGVIANNRFDYCAKRAIKTYVNGLTVSGNIITNPYLNNNRYQGQDKGSLAPDMYSGISIYGNNTTVANNVLQGSGSFYAGIELAASKTIRNITVTGNQITMGPQSNVNGKTSVRIGNIADFSVVSNVLTNGAVGIWTWQNATNGLINGNRITMPKGGGIDLTSYVPNTSRTNIRVTNNVINARDFTIRR